MIPKTSHRFSGLPSRSIPVFAALLAALPLKAAVLQPVSSSGLAKNGTLVTTTAATHRVGSAATDGNGRNMLVSFQLPDFGAVANPFTSASLGLYLDGKSGTPFSFNVDLYGLAAQGTSALPTGAYYEGATVDSSPGVSLIQQDFAITTTSNGSSVTTSAIVGNVNLLNYLNAQYAGGAGALQYVVFRLNPDVGNPGTAAIGYNFGSAQNPGSAGLPSLTYEAIPESATGALLLVSGGFVIVRRRRRN
ncbi:MAG: PEP-CTERM sorting domain-containing protein [Akkermansiaceae bacterium]|nr:PEP-CTERM sorting domain-containing protein [Akkermansiaceae bacterium]